MPLTVGGGSARRVDVRRMLQAAPTVSLNTATILNPISSTKPPASSARSARAGHRRPPQYRRPARLDVYTTAAASPPRSTRVGVGPRRSAAAPAKSSSPHGLRRHQERLRPGAGRAPSPTPFPCRSSRRRPSHLDHRAPHRRRPRGRRLAFDFPLRRIHRAPGQGYLAATASKSAPLAADAPAPQ